jgi:hypothetical protein
MEDATGPAGTRTSSLSTGRLDQEARRLGLRLRFAARTLVAVIRIKATSRPRTATKLDGTWKGVNRHVGYRTSFGVRSTGPQYVVSPISAELGGNRGTESEEASDFRPHGGVDETMPDASG